MEAQALAVAEVESVMPCEMELECSFCSSNAKPAKRMTMFHVNNLNSIKRSKLFRQNFH